MGKKNITIDLQNFFADELELMERINRKLTIAQTVTKDIQDLEILPYKNNLLSYLIEQEKIIDEFLADIPFAVNNNQLSKIYKSQLKISILNYMSNAGCAIQDLLLFNKNNNTIFKEIYDQVLSVE